MRWILGGICALSLTGTSLAASWETSAVRTANGGLIRIGMSSQEARKELGQAESDKTQRARSSENKNSKRKEILTYRGQDGLYSITLSGGLVVRILVTADRD